MASPSTPNPNAAADTLARALGERLDGEVRFGDGDRRLFAQDASHYRQVPVGVVMPRHADDLIAAVELCREHRAAILMRGGGTSLAGQACNVAVVIDCSKYMNRILELDPEARTARVQPGVVLDDLREAAEVHGLTFGPDPSTHAWCTLGGMIGNNACGVHSVMAGKTVDNVIAMDVLTPDGTRLTVGPTPDDQLAELTRRDDRVGRIYRELVALRDDCGELVRQRYPDIPRRVSGYNLDELLPERGFNVARALVGTEGTCVVILEATVRLVPSPPERTLALLGYPDEGAAGDAVPAILEHRPIGLEGMDHVLAENMRAKGLEPRGLTLLPAGGAWLFVEFGADAKADADAAAAKLIERLTAGDGDWPTASIATDPADMQSVWDARASGLGASARLVDGTDTWEGWEDAAVHPNVLGNYLRDFRKLLNEHDLHATLYGHFGQGLVHCRVNFDMTSPAGLATYRRFVEAAADLVIRYGGSLSGEHGDGQSRAELLPKMFGDELIEAFARFKKIWDPDGRMNPHKVVDPYRLDENLHHGAGYEPAAPETHFHYPDDDRRMGRAVGRCIGVGKCRREAGGTMCPSYKVLREEKHTTRGRAHLLQAMLDGELPDGWRNRDVKQSLDLCLSCKGCKRDCPAGVDVAMYKAEFLAHHYRGRLRPPRAYAFGLIHRWARLGGMAPRLVNLLTQTPGLSTLAKGIGGMPPARRIPAFAPRPFKKWFFGRRPHAPGPRRTPVILWADTFNNYFHARVAEAATAVLENAGFEVIVPRQHLCCGRPLYDFGMLATAKKLLAGTLDALEAHIDAGVPMVGLEPSCIAVFRDELGNLFPDDRRARKVARQTRTLAELLSEHDGYIPPTLTGQALFHGHCHHKAVMNTDADVALLRRTGLKVETPDTGCCGMAGSFGFTKQHYDVSVAVGEQVLLPAVRRWPADGLIVSDGFSCQEQIQQLTGRRVHHLAEVLAMDSAPADAPA